jgi:hypothetical protein
MISNRTQRRGCDRCYLFESRKRIDRIRTAAEVAVQRNSIDVIKQIKRLEHGFDGADRSPEISAQSCIHVEKLKPLPALRLMNTPLTVGRAVVPCIVLLPAVMLNGNAE